MNCRTFELQVADWLSGRLSENISAKMSEHKAKCEACARLADTEADLQRRLSTWRTTQTANDLWPKIAERLDAGTSGRLQPPVFSIPRLTAWLSEGVFGYNRRAFAAAACVLAILVPVAISTTLLTKQPGVGQQPTTPATQPEVGLQMTNEPSIAYSLFSDTGQGDPSIDDPIGGTMEHVWTHVSTDNKDTASR